MYNFNSFLEKNYTENTKNPTGMAEKLVCRHLIVPDALFLK